MTDLTRDAPYPLVALDHARQGVLGGSIDRIGNPRVGGMFVEEVDDAANPVGAKRVGALRISGAGAAVANAMYDAGGVRARDRPITPDKLLAGLPPV